MVASHPLAHEAAGRAAAKTLLGLGIDAPVEALAWLRIQRMAAEPLGSGGRMMVMTTASPSC